MKDILIEVLFGMPQRPIKTVAELRSLSNDEVATVNEKIIVSCEMEVTLKMIGGKCKPLILHYLIESGTKRYSELQSFVKTIPKKTLTMQLRDMETDGLIMRTVYPDVPPKVEYSATELGKSLYPILELMCEWGQKNIGDRFEVINKQCLDED